MSEGPLLGAWREAFAGVAALRAAERGTHEAARVRHRLPPVPWWIGARPAAGCLIVALLGGLALGGVASRLLRGLDEDGVRLLASVIATSLTLVALRAGLAGSHSAPPRPGLGLLLAAPVPPGALVLRAALKQAGTSFLPLAAGVVGVGTVAGGFSAVGPLIPTIVIATAMLEVTNIAVGAAATSIQGRLSARTRERAMGCLNVLVPLVGVLGWVTLVALSGTRTPASVAATILSLASSPGRPFAAAALGEPAGLALAVALAVGLAALAIGLAPLARAEPLLRAAIRQSEEAARLSQPTVRRQRARWPRPFGRGATAIAWKTLAETMAGTHWAVASLAVLLFLALSLTLGIGLRDAPGTPQAFQHVGGALAALPTLLASLLCGAARPGLRSDLARPSWLLRYPAPPGATLAALLAPPGVASVVAALLLVVPYVICIPASAPLALVVLGAGAAALAATAIARAFLALGGLPPGARPLLDLILPMAAQWLPHLGTTAIALALAIKARWAPHLAVAVAAVLPIMVAGALWPPAVRALRRLEAPGGAR